MCAAQFCTYLMSPAVTAHAGIENLINSVGYYRWPSAFLTPFPYPSTNGLKIQQI